MARRENLHINELEVDNLIGDGGAGVRNWRKKIYLNGALGSDGNDGLAFDRPLKTLTTADDKITTGYGDVIVLEESTSSISLSSAYTWSYNLCGLVGTSANRFNQRARIGMSTTFTPMITVSGYGNKFANIYTMHGTAAGDYVGWLISGARNAFINVHFGGPMNADQGGHASYNGVNITGSENYFKDCVFGTSTISRDELTPNVTLGAGTYTVFENCIFTMFIADTDPYFIAVANTSGNTQAYFKNCLFYAMSENHSVTAAVAFTFSGGSTAAMILDSGCSFCNVSHLAASASMKYIFAPTVFAATVDELNLIAINSATY